MSSRDTERRKQQLITMGKAKGYLTYDEVNDHMPEEIVSSDAIDDWLGALGDEGIEVVDAGTAGKGAAAAAQGTAAPAKAEAAAAPAKPEVKLTGEGTLVVASSPWCNVSIDGADKGPTPVSAKVQAGKHTVVLSNPEFKISRTLSVMVQPGETVRKKLDFSE
jgi:hypothetical protein